MLTSFVQSILLGLGAQSTLNMFLKEQAHHHQESAILMQYDSFLLSVVIPSISTAQEITFCFHTRQEKLPVQIWSKFFIKPGKLKVLIELAIIDEYQTYFLQYDADDPFMK